MTKSHLIEKINAFHLWSLIDKNCEYFWLANLVNVGSYSLPVHSRYLYVKGCNENNGNSPYMKGFRKTYVFPRSICNFRRFRVLSFIKRARFLAREGSWAKDCFTPTWRNMAGYIVRTAGKWQLALAQGPEIKGHSASQQLFFA